MTPPEKEQEILKKPASDFRGVELTGLEQAVVSLAEGCIDTAEKLRIAVEALECIEKKSLTTGFVYSNRGKIYQRIAFKALAKIEGENDE